MQDDKFVIVHTDVTILERNTQLLARDHEPEVGRSIGDIFAEEGIRVVFNATPEAVRHNGSEVVTTAVVAGRERQYRAERLVARVSTR